MPEIKAVLFDYDNTLGNRWASAVIMYGKLLDAADPAVTDDLLKEALIQDMLTFDQKGNVSVEYTVERIEKKYGIHIRIPDLSSWWYGNHWKYAQLFSGAEEVLASLRKKYRIGVITNGDSASQKLKLEKTGIAGLMDLILVSGDLPFAKPDPEIFQLAAGRLSLQMQECVYAGDTFSNDIYGALKAGMHAVWVCHDEMIRSTYHGNVPVIKDLRDLEKTIESCF